MALVAAEQNIAKQNSNANSLKKGERIISFRSQHLKQHRNTDHHQVSVKAQKKLFCQVLLRRKFIHCTASIKKKWFVALPFRGKTIPQKYNIMKYLNGTENVATSWQMGNSWVFSFSKRHLWRKGKVKMVILKPITSKKKKENTWSL